MTYFHSTFLHHRPKRWHLRRRTLSKIYYPCSLLQHLPSRLCQRLGYGDNQLLRFLQQQRQPGSKRRLLLNQVLPLLLSGGNQIRLDGGQNRPHGEPQWVLLLYPPPLHRPTSGGPRQDTTSVLLKPRIAKLTFRQNPLPAQNVWATTSSTQSSTGSTVMPSKKQDDAFGDLWGAFK